MFQVVKDGDRYPFSKGILARSIAPTGLPIDTIYDIVRTIRDELEADDIDEIESGGIKDLVCRELRERGFTEQEQYYHTSRQIAKLEHPLFILIGGTTGAGKSAISAELAHRLGIERLIGTDTIREIMRYMIPKTLLPALHQSSFTAGEVIDEIGTEDVALSGFTRQVSLVSEGVRAYMERGQKEGLNTIINGVHLVPGLINMTDHSDTYLFHYIINVGDREEHIHRFRLRSVGSLREPERYISRIDDIRKIQGYITSAAEEHDVRVIENREFEETIQIIMKEEIDS